MSSSFKHNKKRNSGLVYEFLVRRLGLTLIDGDKTSYEKTLGIIKKYYSPGQPLAREKEIFDVISKSRGLSEGMSRKILDEVKKHVAKLDVRKIDIKKSNIIKEIHYTFGQDFFDVHRIPQYRLYASIQLLADQYAAGTKSLNEGTSRVQLEESIVKFMTTSSEKTISENKGEKIDSLVAAIAVKKFEQKYSGALNEAQKKTIRKFMNYCMTGNKEQFAREIEEERRNILSKLNESRSMKCFKEDKIMAERLDESVKTLSSLDKLHSEKTVQEILLFHKLIQELNSND